MTTERLPDGGELTIRAFRPADAPAIAALYRRLDPEDRWRRALTSTPSAGAIERMFRDTLDEGVALVVSNRDQSGLEEIIGEATCARLPSGNGRLGITVAPEWRGWLGHHLLAAVLAHAAAQGLPNVEAETVATNRTMLALVNARGAMTLAQPDPHLIRVVMSSTTAVPTWPEEHDRPRVLVEGADGPLPFVDELLDAGIDVIECQGPERRMRGCPLLLGEPCALADNADAIVMVELVSDDRWVDLHARHAAAHARAPVRVQLPAENATAIIELVRRVTAPR